MAKSATPNDWDRGVPEVPATRGDGGDASPRPITNTAPGSPDYALSGPLGAKVAPMRKPQGETAGAVPPKTYGGSE
jgi:hypothetical protein